MARKLVQMKRRPRRGEKRKKRQKNIVHILDHDRIIEKLINNFFFTGKKNYIKRRLLH